MHTYIHFAADVIAVVDMAMRTQILLLQKANSMAIFTERVDTFKLIRKVILKHCYCKSNFVAHYLAKFSFL